MQMKAIFKELYDDFNIPINNKEYLELGGFIIVLTYNWVYKNEHKKFFFKENAERYNKEYLEKKELRFSKKDLINCCTHIISENKLIINKVENWIKNNA
jgi:hypothetical protein